MIDRTLTTPLLRWWSARATRRRPSIRPTSSPPVPSARQERHASRLFRLLNPALGNGTPPAPPADLTPWETVSIERRERPGRLAATFFPARGVARGTVLLAHPWMVWGQAYFYRRGRLEALRAVGYHALTFDLGGVGGSDRPVGFDARDVADALAWLRRRGGPELPLHLWGVSCGGYWAHMVLSGAGGEVDGAMFEDVSPHLLEWSQRMAPWGLPCYLAFRRLFPDAYRYLDLRRHAPHLRAAAVAYAGGADDPGIWPHETAELARLAGGEHAIVDDAGHLGAIKKANRRVIALALATFARAERRRAELPSGIGPPSPRRPPHVLRLRAA